MLISFCFKGSPIIYCFSLKELQFMIDEEDFSELRVEIKKIKVNEIDNVVVNNEPITFFGTLPDFINLMQQVQNDILNVG